MVCERITGGVLICNGTCIVAYSSYSNLLQCSSSSVVVGRYNYFEQIRVLKAGFKCLNICAWNNGIRPLFYFHWFIDQEVMINRSSLGALVLRRER